MTEETGLSNLREYLPATARVKAEPKNLDWKTGDELYESSNDNIRIGITGESNSGKTYTAIAFLEHRIVNKASDDHYIKRFFNHKPDLRDAVLEMSIEQRRVILEKAHLMVFIDFDNRGLEKLISGYVINPRLYSRIKYRGARDRVEGIQGLFDAYDMAKAHEEAGWGKMGIWVVVDNMTEVWEEVQSDYTQQAHDGLTHLEIRAAAMAKHPGKDSVAKGLQGEELGAQFAWNTIKGQQKQLFKPLLNSGWNIALTAPPKFRKKTVKDIISGQDVELQMNSIGGAKEVILWCDWVIHRYVATDGVTRIAKFDKCRWTGLSPREVYDPTPENLEGEMERLLQEHIELQIKKFELKKYAETLPISLADYGLPDIEEPKIIEAEFRLAEIPLTLPTPQLPKPVPLPVPDNGKPGLSDLNSVLPLPVWFAHRNVYSAHQARPRMVLQKLAQDPGISQPAVEFRGRKDAPGAPTNTVDVQVPQIQLVAALVSSVLVPHTLPSTHEAHAGTMD